MKLSQSQPFFPESQPKVNIESTFSQPFLGENTILEGPRHFQCKYCQKYFKFKQSMYKHIKYTCKKNDDEDFKELARLLNERTNEFRKFQKNTQKQIDKLTQKLQIQNVNKGTLYTGTVNNKMINNVVNMNIKLLNFKDTDYSHLTTKDYLTCINNCNYCVKTLIEKVHFNKKKPENMNIYISNIKGNYIMIYKENEWQICNRKEKIDDLYEYNEIVLETWYDDYKEKYPEIIKSFQRYLHNKDGNHLLNKMKDEILLMLYNKRKLTGIEG
tara:strand:+ start:314 stop:1126 length:813 start_codon:yes stop_codon:yes gene_type:complete